jgi:cystathionine beta-lyase
VTSRCNNRKTHFLQFLKKMMHAAVSARLLHVHHCRALHIASKLIHSGHTAKQSSGIRPSSPPIYQTATFQQSSPTAFDDYDYSRSGNPTRDELQSALGALEYHDDGSMHVSAFAFNSGMAAISTVFAACGGSTPVIAGADLYGGSLRLLGKVIDSEKQPVTYVDMTDLEQVENALKKAFEHRAKEQEHTALVFCESPSNPLMRITDLRAVGELCKRFEAILCVDNTIMSPLFQKPLEIGADIVIHSATKFLNGHGDVTAGVAVTKNSDVAEKIAFFQNANGNALGPFDSWLLLRGIRTLSVRMHQQQNNAQKIYKYLCNEFGEESVYYPGFGPQAALHSSQSSGHGSVLSFSTKNNQLSINLLRNLKLFKTQVSFGSVASSIELPWFHSHASIPAHLKSQADFKEDLIRMSVGVEHADDLCNDLKASLSKSRGSFNSTHTSKTSSSVSGSKRLFSSSTKFSSATKCGDSTASVQGGQHRLTNRFSDALTTPIAMTSAFWFNNSQVRSRFSSPMAHPLLFFQRNYWILPQEDTKALSMEDTEILQHKPWRTN